MALSYGLLLNMSFVMSIQNQCTLANYIISVERLNQYMHIPSENLKADCKSLKRKIVFRSDPRKFVKLKYECEEFLKMVVTSVGLIKDVDSMDTQQISDQVCNWQYGGFSKFPGQLPDLYHSYYGFSAFSMLEEPGVNPNCVELGITDVAAIEL